MDVVSLLSTDGSKTAAKDVAKRETRFGVVITAKQLPRAQIRDY